VSLDDHYNTLGNVRRYTLTASNFSAAGTEAWEDVEQDIACHIQPMRASELQALGKTTAEVTHRMFCAAGLDIRPRDLIVEGNPIEAFLGIDDTIYEVDGVIDAAARGHHTEALLLERVDEEVDGG
jgi:hypothetical protein